MDNTENISDLEGTREKCIYSLRTFVNEDGFKIEEHTPVDEKDGVPQFYGFYLVNTEIGPIDRYFRFGNQTNVADCFDSFRVLAEQDAEQLSQAMKKESEMLDAQADAAIPPPPPESQMPSPPQPNTELLDENGFPIT
tara:strand:- start:1560 stop:1973 length:414 start_codon:yes stop_codon:yes gene_type:complete